MVDTIMVLVCRCSAEQNKQKRKHFLYQNRPLAGFATELLYSNASKVEAVRLCIGMSVQVQRADKNGVIVGSVSNNAELRLGR